MLIPATSLQQLAETAGIATQVTTWLEKRGFSNPGLLAASADSFPRCGRAALGALEKRDKDRRGRVASGRRRQVCLQGRIAPPLDHEPQAPRQPGGAESNSQQGSGTSR